MYVYITTFYRKIPIYLKYTFHSHQINKTSTSIVGFLPNNSLILRFCQYIDKTLTSTGNNV